MAAGIRQPPAHRPKARADPRNRKIAALVGARTGCGPLRQRSSQTCSRRRKPALRAKIWANLHRMRGRKDLCRDTCNSQSKNEKRCRNRAARGRRTTTSDHTTSSSSLAGVRVTMGISTHILDTALGRPASEVPVTLAFMTNAALHATLAARHLSRSLRNRRLL